MKKVLIGILAFIMVLGLVGCSETLEQFSENNSIRKVVSEDEMYYIWFKNGEVEVSHNFYEYVNIPGFYVGKQPGSGSEKLTYTYEEMGDGQILCNGVIYDYSISGYKVTFDPAFLGIAREWNNN